MCVNRDNTSPQEITNLRGFVASLNPASPLTGFLTFVADIVEHSDGGLCVAMEGEPEQMQQQQQSGPMPGIYPPGSFPPVSLN